MAKHETKFPTTMNFFSALLFNRNLKLQHKRWLSLRGPERYALYVQITDHVLEESSFR